MELDDEFEESLSNESDIYALGFIKEFLEGLISEYSKTQIGSFKQIGLTKALYLVDNFGAVDFDDCLIINAGTNYEEGGSDYYCLTFYSDEIIISQEGNEFDGSISYDDVYYEYYIVGQ